MITKESTVWVFSELQHLRFRASWAGGLWNGQKLWDKRGCVGVEIGSSTSILRGLNVLFFSAFLSWYTCLWAHKFPKKEIKVSYTHLFLFIWLGAISECLITPKLEFVMKFIWRLRCLIWVELEFWFESRFRSLCSGCDKWKLAWLSEWPQLWKWVPNLFSSHATPWIYPATPSWAPQRWRKNSYYHITYTTQ